MKVTDRLIQDTRKKEKKHRAHLKEEEEICTYRTRVRHEAVNREPGAFGTVLGEGLNTRRNVFDETAVFHTEERQAAISESTKEIDGE